MAVVAISQKLFVMGSVLEKLLAITKSFAKLILKRFQGWFFNVFYQVGQLAFVGLDKTSFLIVLNFNPNTTYLPKILIRKAARIFKDGSLAWHFLARKDFVLVWICNKAFFPSKHLSPFEFEPHINQFFSRNLMDQCIIHGIYNFLSPVRHRTFYIQCWI